MIIGRVRSYIYYRNFRILTWMQVMGLFASKFTLRLPAEDWFILFCKFRKFESWFKSFARFSMSIGVKMFSMWSWILQLFLIRHSWAELGTFSNNLFFLLSPLRFSLLIQFPLSSHHVKTSGFEEVAKKMQTEIVWEERQKNSSCDWRLLAEE